MRCYVDKKIDCYDNYVAARKLSDMVLNSKKIRAWNDNGTQLNKTKKVYRYQDQGWKNNGDVKKKVDYYILSKNVWNIFNACISQFLLL